jgi:RNA polymerase sigma-70 factor (ECF subfamily)
MSQISVGDKLAMKDVYERHAPHLESFVKNWLYDPSQAADLVHETMLEVWRNAGKFEGRSSLKSWIFSIARNKSIDSNRRNSRVTYTDEVPDFVEDTITQEEYMLGVQNAKYLKAAMADLSESHRRVLHLAFFDDMKYEDIALIESCPVGTVKTRIMHAKKALLYLVKKHKDFEPF